MVANSFSTQFSGYTLQQFWKTKIVIDHDTHFSNIAAVGFFLSSTSQVKVLVVAHRVGGPPHTHSPEHTIIFSVHPAAREQKRLQLFVFMRI